MSDIFDHALDACESMIDEAYWGGWEGDNRESFWSRYPSQFWKCDWCGTWHHNSHSKCWKCQYEIKVDLELPKEFK